MRLKYHINPVTWEPAECKASHFAYCNFGEEEDHYSSVHDAQQAIVAAKAHDLGLLKHRKSVLNSRAALQAKLEQYFSNLYQQPIPTVLENSFLKFNLADVKGRALEAVVAKFFADNNIRMVKEPNGPDAFPDYKVLTRVDGWVPLELKEESLDSTRPGKSNKRIMRIGAAIDSIHRGNELFDAVFLTAEKVSDEESVTFHRVNFEKFLDITGPTLNKKDGSVRRVIGFDTNTKNICRTAQTFKSKEDAVAAIVTLYENVKDEEWQDKQSVLESIKETYGL